MHRGGLLDVSGAAPASVRLRFGKKAFAFFGRNIGSQCRLGFSALLGEATMATLMFVGNHVFMQYLGDDGVGAFGVSCYYLLVFMIECQSRSLPSRLSVQCGHRKDGTGACDSGSFIDCCSDVRYGGDGRFRAFPETARGTFPESCDIAARMR